METIINYLKRKLSEAGPAKWGEIATEAKVAATLPRKIAYDNARNNPRLSTVQPLIDYFREQDAKALKRRSGDRAAK